MCWEQWLFKHIFNIAQKRLDYKNLLQYVRLHEASIDGTEHTIDRAKQQRAMCQVVVSCLNYWRSGVVKRLALVPLPLLPENFVRYRDSRHNGRSMRGLWDFVQLANHCERNVQASD